MVNGSTLTLTVGTVITVVAVDGGAFVEIDAVVLQGVDQHFHSAGNFPLGISIFHPQEKNTAALVSHTLGGQTLHQVAQMDEAGGRRCHTGDNSALGNITKGELFLQRFGSVSYIGKQKVGENLIIHKTYLVYIVF